MRLLLPAVLHVGEAALTLGRNTDYEIPFHKKQAARLQQQMGDLERRQAEALKSASAAAADYEQVSVVGLGRHHGSGVYSLS